MTSKDGMMKWKIGLDILLVALLVLNAYLTYERIKSTERLDGSINALRLLWEKT